MVRKKGAAGSSNFRDFPGRRWLIVVLRAAHLVGLVGTGAALLGSATLGAQMPFVLTLMFSGMSMIAIDLWAAPGYLAEVSGIAIVVKLALLAWLVLDPPRQLPLFWTVIVFSAVVAHAPAWVRHRRVIGTRQG